ncbi:MAG TPA: asparaginase [Candidatus Saccharimonadales bacterium]|nr:asparaginase [Candidatus Saccharimonadales bacterium]
MAAARPRVALVFTGGTIDSVGVDRLDLAWYIEAGKRLDDGELVERVPELDRIAAVEEVPFRRLPSQSITDGDLADLVTTIHEIFESDRADGVVITHGTNTLEETAYYLHLALKTDRPVVIVGSMRPSSAVSADGYLNLLNGVRVAADPASAGMGVLVVLNDTILGARDVTKTATYRVETFQGRDLGPLGYADNDGRVLFYHRPVRPHTTATEFQVGEAALPRVDVVVSYLGADATMIDAAVAAGAKGIVSAGTGAGRPTPAEDAALLRASEAGVVICQGTRVGSGRAVRSPGLVKRGWVASDNLQPWKARILLRFALATTSDVDEIQRMFDTY